MPTPSDNTRPAPAPAITADAGFVALRRSEESRELVKHPKAFTLLAVIALRARWSEKKNLHGLTLGQALIGDHAAYGLSRKEERVARAQLAKLGLATFAGTTRGTIATLTGSAVFETGRVQTAHKQGHPEGHQISEEDLQNRASPGANKGPTKGQRGATNEQYNKETKKPTIQGTDVPAFPESLSTEAFKAAWKEWTAYRHERRLGAWTPRTLAAKLTELAGMGEARAIAAIRHSISNGWSGIFPPKGKDTPAAAPSIYANRF